MRTLYRDFYQRGKGFSMDDMIAVVNRLTRQDYRDFYRRYVWGVEVPPYDTIYGYAGYRVEKTTQKSPVFGFGGRFRSGGLYINSVEPNSPSSEAGLVIGDIILKINGQELQRIKPNELTGTTVKLTIKHEGQEKEIPLKVGAHDEVAYHLVSVAQPTADQLKIRQGWLKAGQ
jgi:predicted metalloprotease with PDZ domain